MKKEPDALVTAENESGNAKHVNETRRPQYCRKRVQERKTLKRDMTPSKPPKMSPGAQNMKTGPDALGTAENVSGSAKYEKGIWCPRYRWKWIRERKTLERDPAPTVPPKMSSGAQNMKTRPGSLGTAEKMSGSAKHENATWRPWYRRKQVRGRKTWKRDLTTSVPPKMSPGAQNMKKEPDAIGTAENEFGSAKHENGTWRPRYRRKHVRERKNMKKGRDALGTTENESGSSKHLNGTRRPLYRQN
jgi:hypothetical protein